MGSNSFKKRSSLLLILFLAMIVLFQNCGGAGGFHTLSPETLNLGSGAPNDGSSGGNDDGNGNPTPTPTPPGATPTPPGMTPTPTPTPTPPAATLKKTHFYFGRGGGIDVLEVNHATGQFSVLGAANYSGGAVAALAYDKVSKTVMAASEDGPLLQIYDYVANTGALAQRISFNNYAPQTTHMTLVPTANGLDMFSVSYFGRMDHHRLNQNLSQLSFVQSTSFGGNAKTHWGSFDSKRNLLYVANLGLDRIEVYKYSAQTGLTALTSIAVVAARTVVYDSHYDKLYVGTESFNGPSSIRVYSIAAAGASYTFTDAGSLPTTIWGSDIKVDRVHGYVLGLGREQGKEAIFGMPITATGVKDNSRASFSIPISQRVPRNLELSEDGQYAVVGMTSSDAENLVAYKLQFNAQNVYVSSQKIFQQKLTGGNGYMGSLSIPVY